MKWLAERAAGVGGQERAGSGVGGSVAEDGLRKQRKQLEAGCHQGFVGFVKEEYIGYSRAVLSGLGSQFDDSFLDQLGQVTYFSGP